MQRAGGFCFVEKNLNNKINMSFLDQVHLSKFVDTASSEVLTHFLTTNSLFQKFLIKEFIHNLPKLNPSTHQILDIYDTLNAKQIIPKHNGNNKIIKYKQRKSSLPPYLTEVSNIQNNNSFFIKTPIHITSKIIDYSENNNLKLVNKEFNWLYNNKIKKDNSAKCKLTNFSKASILSLQYSFGFLHKLALFG